jgi:predicted metalloprotease with PDZ domain
MLPYVTPAHRWVSEGFAQYYQNVLLARSGTYEPLDAWQKLYDGLERGRQSRPELSPNEATARGLRNGRMKIYWSGAAIALMADVTLRERSGGTMTLDDVMGRLQDCCLPSDRSWSGPELFDTLDTLAGTSVFMPLYRRYADTAGFPDTRPLFDRLGLAVSGNELKVRRGGELQHIRTAITEADSSMGRREQLASAPRRK